jgi:hypothetical protein
MSPALRRAGALALALCSYAASGAAQFPDLVDVGGQYLPGVPLEDPRPVRSQVASYEGGLNLPLVLGERSFLIPGIGFHTDAVSYQRAPTSFTQLRAFHSAELPLLFVQLLPHDWSLAVRVAPGMAADVPKLDAQLLRVSGLLLATHTFSERLVAGGGGLASYAFGTFLPLPAAYVEWKPVDGLRLESFLPAFVDLRYTFWERLEVGVRADVAGNSYAVRDERIRNAWPCRAQTDDPASGANEALAQPDQCFDHVAYSVGVAGIVASVRLFGSVWLNGFAGHSVYRRLELRNADDEIVTGGAQRMQDAFFVRSGVTWRLPRD